MDYKKLVKAFNNENNGRPIGFIAFNYTNKQNETSKRLVYIGASYENAKEKDILTLTKYLARKRKGYIASEKYTKEVWVLAMNELLNSLKSPDTNRSEGQKEAYVSISKNGCLKWSVEKQQLYIHGTLVRKTVTEEGDYPEVNSSSKTIAKNVIRKNYLSTGKYRSFKLENLESDIKINGDVIEIGN